MNFMKGETAFWRLLISEVVAAWRMRMVRRALCVVIPIGMFGFMCFWAVVMHTIHTYHQCSDHDSRIYLGELCDLYNTGYLSGSLCEPLCVTREIQFKKCLGHGVKLHVLQAEWNANTIILKTPKELGNERAMSHVKEAGSNLKLTRDQFIEQANWSLFYNIAGKKYVESTMNVLEDIFSECDLLEDGILNYNEAITCFQLVETEEYIIYSLLQRLGGIPDVYGTCGNMYAIQYAPSEPFLGYETIASETRSWNFRARLALALIGLAESLEETPFGTLYLCDVQESNFGVVRRDEKLVAKAIDVDISWFEPAMVSTLEFEKNKTCTSNSDCEIISCLVECKSGKCSGDLHSNNLQSICLKIFQQRYRLHPALLQNPPTNIKQQLETLLDKCANPDKRMPHIPWDIVAELRTVLQNSLQELR